MLIVRELNLDGRDPMSIVDTAPLFGSSVGESLAEGVGEGGVGGGLTSNGTGKGLGLDSLDALQLAMTVEEQFGVRIPEGDVGRAAFASVSALAAYILKHAAAGGRVSLDSVR